MSSFSCNWIVGNDPINFCFIWWYVIVFFQFKKKNGNEWNERQMCQFCAHRLYALAQSFLKMRIIHRVNYTITRYKIDTKVSQTKKKKKKWEKCVNFIFHKKICIFILFFCAWKFPSFELIESRKKRAKKKWKVMTIYTWFCISFRF